MNPNDPERAPGGEETTDWPAAQQPPTGASQDEESTRPTPSAPRSIHEETTLDAGQFLQSQQRPPTAPPPPPGWAGGPTGPQQPPQPGAHPPYQQPQTWSAGHQPPPTITPRRKPSLSEQIARHRWWVLGGAGVLAVVLVIALVTATGGQDRNADDGPPTSPAQVPAGPTTTVPGTPTAAPPPQPPPPPPGPVLGADALPGLLLPPEQISERMNTPGMEPMTLVHRPLPGSVTPPHCTGAWGPAYEATYNGSGFTAIAVQGVFKQPTHQLVQAAVSFPDPGAAKAFYDKQSADWNACRSTHVRYEQGGVSEADIGVPAVTGDILSVMVIPTTAKVAGQQCERDMTVRGNVIVDVRACSPTVGSAGLSIARAIADKIAPAP